PRAVVVGGALGRRLEELCARDEHHEHAEEGGHQRPSPRDPASAEGPSTTLVHGRLPWRNTPRGPRATLARGWALRAPGERNVKYPAMPADTTVTAPKRPVRRKKVRAVPCASSSASRETGNSSRLSWKVA